MSYTIYSHATGISWMTQEFRAGFLTSVHIRD